uniref:Uncharacterized protein n=1 Tax=Setaria italica TaxID=4555 RepID=K3Z1T1_SETIT
MTESWLKLVSYSKAYGSIALKDFDCTKMLVSKTDVWCSRKSQIARQNIFFLMTNSLHQCKIKIASKHNACKWKYVC